MSYSGSCGTLINNFFQKVTLHVCYVILHFIIYFTFLFHFINLTFVLQQYVKITVLTVYCKQYFVKVFSTCFLYPCMHFFQVYGLHIFLAHLFISIKQVLYKERVMKMRWRERTRKRALGKEREKEEQDSCRDKRSRETSLSARINIWDKPGFLM